MKRAGPAQDLPLASELTWRESSKGRAGARMENWAFRTQKLRRVRMTYFDGGEAGQAFNSLCYPEYGWGWRRGAGRLGGWGGDGRRVLLVECGFSLEKGGVTVPNIDRMYPMPMGRD